ncbi:MAG TPA: multidrug efflux SMR transporter, partial [Microlunatus sp.]|nr:multidrug efflux SMR transporter [Microlunatus sp.]
AVGMKLSNGFTRPGISAVTVVGMVASFVFLALALKRLPLGTAYTVWTGIGAVGTALIGILAFSESRDPVRLLSIAAIVAGVIGLKATS